MAHANICMALQQTGDLKAESLDKAAAVLLFGYETPLPVVWEMGERRGGRAETEQDNGFVSFTLLSSQNLSQGEDERKVESKCICAWSSIFTFKTHRLGLRLFLVLAIC